MGIPEIWYDCVGLDKLVKISVIVPCSQIHQPVLIDHLAGEAVGTAVCTVGFEYIAERFVGLCEQYLAFTIGQLAHRSQGIREVVERGFATILTDPPESVQVCAVPVLQHFGQVCVDIERVVDRVAIDRLAQPVAKPIVGVGIRIFILYQVNKSVGSIIGVGT